MSEFNFKSSVCTDRNQSERLLALGLKKETADMFYSTILENDDAARVCWEGFWNSNKAIDGYIRRRCIPAWSLHRLIEMMPKCVRAHSCGDDSPRLHPYVPKFDYQGVTIENTDEILADFYHYTDLFDNIISCIEWLIKEGYFPKEYLV